MSRRATHAAFSVPDAIPRGRRSPPQLEIAPAALRSVPPRVSPRPGILARLAPRAIAGWSRHVARTRRFTIGRSVDEELLALVQQLFLPLGTSADGRRVVMFLSPDGRASERTSMAVAETLALQTRRTVCLVDANLREPSLHRHYGLGNATGFGELLAGRCAVDALTTLVPPAVWVMTAGQSRVRAALTPTACERGVAMLLDAFDFVVIAAASLGVRPEAIALARAVDGVALVVDSATSRRDTARHGVDALRAAGARVSGVVLTRPSVAASSARPLWP